MLPVVLWPCCHLRSLQLLSFHQPLVLQLGGGRAGAVAGLMLGELVAQLTQLGVQLGDLPFALLTLENIQEKKKKQRFRGG